MTNMKAVRIHAYGGTNTLIYEDAPRPVVGDNELLIRGLNPARPAGANTENKKGPARGSATAGSNIFKRCSSDNRFGRRRSRFVIRDYVFVSTRIENVRRPISAA